MNLRRVGYCTLLATALAAGGIAAHVTGGASTTWAEPTPKQVSTTTAIPESAQESEQPPTLALTGTPATYRIVAGGDILLHQGVNESALQEDGSYDYSEIFADIAPILQSADLAICHLETPVAPDGMAPSYYPVFGAPKDIVPAIKEAGWTSCTTASNHSFDKGFAGVTETLDELDKFGILHTGTARTADEAQQVVTYTLGDDPANAVTIAHIAATYDTNGIPVPEENSFSVDLINPDRVIELAGKARANGADLVMVSVHSGTEYQTAPDEAQRVLAEQLAASGVIDLYIGHHAHVPQPVTTLPSSVVGGKMWIAYGHGNLVSGQNANANPSASVEVGYLSDTEITRDVDGQVFVSGMRAIPTTVVIPGHKIYLIEDELVSNDTSISEDALSRRLELVWDAVNYSG